MPECVRILKWFVGASFYSSGSGLEYIAENRIAHFSLKAIANMMVLLKKSVAFEMEADSARMSIRAVMSVSLARWCQRRCSGGRGWQRASGMGFESVDE